MYLTKEVKAENFLRNTCGEAKNTGSSEGRLHYLLKINHLTEHFKKKPQGFHTERSLVKLVGKRRSLLDLFN